MLFPGTISDDTPLDDRSAYERVALAYDALGIESRNKLSSGRKTHAQTAQTSGASLTNILISEHRSGALGALANYLDPLPVATLLSVAGGRDGCTYELRRDMIPPPVELHRQVISWAHTERARLNAMPREVDPTANARNAANVCDVLIELGTIFLQDAAAGLADRYPANPLYQLPVFNSALWREYASSVKAHIGAASDMPSLETMGDQQTAAAITALSSKFDHLVTRIPPSPAMVQVPSVAYMPSAADSGTTGSASASSHCPGWRSNSYESACRISTSGTFTCCSRWCRT